MAFMCFYLPYFRYLFKQRKWFRLLPWCFENENKSTDHTWLLGSLCVRNDEPEECRQNKERKWRRRRGRSNKEKKSQEKISDMLMTKFQTDSGTSETNCSICNVESPRCERVWPTWRSFYIKRQHIRKHIKGRKKFQEQCGVFMYMATNYRLCCFDNSSL